MIDYTIDYIKAHEFSAGHRKRLLQDRKCGCFYCLKIFAPKEISSWIEDVGGTAICPYCGIDSVIGEHRISGADAPILVLRDRNTNIWKIFYGVILS